jgi:hypothetical protein
MSSVRQNLYADTLGGPIDQCSFDGPRALSGLTSFK